jgi:superfamily II RNA helicase
VQARRLKQEQAKTQSLEASMARMQQDFQRQREAQQAAFAADRKEAEADIAALRRLAKARGHALHKVRAMAHGVLRQRSEVEAFLVTSIRAVRTALHIDDLLFDDVLCLAAGRPQHVLPYALVLLMSGCQDMRPWAASSHLYLTLPL